jgi:photosynthetic reaction center cytochrome c subunit
MSPNTVNPQSPSRRYDFLLANVKAIAKAGDSTHLVARVLHNMHWRRVMFKRFSSTLTISVFLLPSPEKVPLAQTPAANSPHSKTAARVYRNVQVLKDIPADDLIPAMQFITYSLGVECSYCHVEGALEKDDKKTKLTARKMIQMMLAINHDNFDSRQVVTCNSCHRGTPRPVSIPTIAEPGLKPSSENPPEADATVNPPSPDDVIAKYLAAIGGAAALSKVKTRQEKGTISVGGRNLPVEIFTSAGGKQLTVVHLSDGDSITAYNAMSGWSSAPNRPAHPIPTAEAVSARLETDLQLPAHMKQLFDQLKSMPPERIGDRQAYVVSGFHQEEIAAKFYFDKDSGYLLRTLRYTKTPLGKSPTQIDNDDYRDQDGLKIPFFKTISRPNSRIAIRIDEVRFNVPIDDARFAFPAVSR